MTDKRYYWLKLNEGFYRSVRIKKLRKLANGVIIYQKMQLASLEKEGELRLRGAEETPEEEIALDIDEDAQEVKNVIDYLLKVDLLEETERGYLLPYVVENLGSETANAQRVREHRKRQALQCNENVTPMKQNCNVDIDIEKDIDIDIDDDILKEKIKETHKQLKSIAERFLFHEGIDRHNEQELLDLEKVYSFGDIQAAIVKAEIFGAKSISYVKKILEA